MERTGLPECDDLYRRSAWTLVEQEPIGGPRIVYRTTTTPDAFEYTGNFTGPGDYRVGAAIVTYKAADHE